MGQRQLRWRFWIEATCAVAAGIGLVLALVWPDWIESTLGAHPDGGDGSFEVAIPLVLFVLALGSAWAGRREWRRVAAT